MSKVCSIHNLDYPDDSEHKYIATGGNGIIQWLDAEIMRSTGLKDKNGMEIYEGEIYHMGDQNIKYKVIYEQGQFVGNQIGNKSLAGLSYWLNRIKNRAIKACEFVNNFICLL